MSDSNDTDKKLDFQWKRSATKRQKLGKSGLVSEDKEEQTDHQATEFVFAIENSRIDNGIAAEEPKKLLIIPLSESSKNNESNIDEIADDSVEKSSKVSTSSKKRPLLLANVSESFLNAKTEEERYKIGVESCADDVHIHSDVYNAVPIEEFGAALLRGMGWDGKLDGKDRRSVASQGNRMGLGVAPPILAKQNKQKLEAKKAVEAINPSSGLAEGKIVKVAAPNSIQYRAMVVKTKGVAGLNRVRVAKEVDGEVLDVNKDFVSLISDRELLAKPFQLSDEKILEINQLMQNTSQTMYHGLKTQPAQPQPLQPQPPSSSSTATTTTNMPSNNNNNSNNRPSSWLRTGIRVKVISERIGGKQGYLQKGTVLDVHSKGIGAIKLDNGTILDPVKEKYLETVLPNVGSDCLVLVGEYVGQCASLLEKDMARNQAIVQLSESLEVIQLTMDDIAAYNS